MLMLIGQGGFIGVGFVWDTSISETCHKHSSGVIMPQGVLLYCHACACPSEYTRQMLYSWYWTVVLVISDESLCQGSLEMLALDKHTN